MISLIVILNVIIVIKNIEMKYNQRLIAFNVYLSIKIIENAFLLSHINCMILLFFSYFSFIYL